MRIDELRTTLREQADEVSAADEVGVQQRNAAVQRRVHAAHGRRRAGVAAVLGVLALAVVGGLVVVPPLLPTPAPRTAGTDEPMVETPPRLAGWPMPALLQVGSRSYSYLRGEQTRDDRNLLRVAVGQSPKRQIIAWSTSPGTQGLVVVSVDGTLVSRSTGGTFEYGTELAPHHPHLVVVRVAHPMPGHRIGLAVYVFEPYA